MAPLNKYEDILGLVGFTDNIEIPEVDTQDAWVRLQARIHSAVAARTPWTGGRPGPGRLSGIRQSTGAGKSRAIGWWPAAAAVVTLVVAGYFLLHRAGKAELRGQASPAMIEIVANEVVNPTAATLPDGSVVRLFQSSSLSYPAKFTDGRRRVELKGAASFAVAPNAHQPFVVAVKDIQITVLGTSFTVNSDYDQTAIRVLSGLIQVTSPRFDLPLKAGESLIITDSFWVKNTDTVVPGKMMLPPPGQPTAPTPAIRSPKPVTTAAKAATTTPKPLTAKQPAPPAKQPTAPVKAPVQPVKPVAPDDLGHQRDLLRAIIKAFVDDRLVDSPDNLISFALTDESLTINGQQQSSSIHKKYKKDYLEIPGVGFYFGPVTMTGTGIFMNRDDLRPN